MSLESFPIFFREWAAAKFLFRGFFAAFLAIRFLLEVIERPCNTRKIESKAATACQRRSCGPFLPICWEMGFLGQSNTNSHWCIERVRQLPRPVG